MVGMMVVLLSPPPPSALAPLHLDAQPASRMSDHGFAQRRSIHITNSNRSDRT